MCRMMQEFHMSGSLPNGSNASFTTSIPKKDNPIALVEYRQISLMGCIYKIIAKVLSKRLKKVMCKVISENQSNFIGGRNMLDIVIVMKSSTMQSPIKSLGCSKLILIKPMIHYHGAFSST